MRQYSRSRRGAPGALGLPTSGPRRGPWAAPGAAGSQPPRSLDRRTVRAADEAHHGQLVTPASGLVADQAQLPEFLPPPFGLVGWASRPGGDDPRGPGSDPPARSALARDAAHGWVTPIGGEFPF